MQNPFIVSSSYQSVTILWLFKCLFSLQQSKPYFWKTKMQSSHPLASNSSMAPFALRIKSSQWPCSPAQDGLCHFLCSLLYPSHPHHLQLCSSATLASSQLPECNSSPRLSFEEKRLFLIFSKPVQILCPSDLSLNTAPLTGKSCLSVRLGWMPLLLILIAPCTFM